MERYGNRGGNSGVNAYEIGLDFIRVRFNRKPRVYQYSYRRAGSSHVDRMKSLALNGSGLNAYINNYVKYLYD